jgi:hypothetical protein
MAGDMRHALDGVLTWKCSVEQGSHSEWNYCLSGKYNNDTLVLNLLTSADHHFLYSDFLISKSIEINCLVQFHLILRFPGISKHYEGIQYGFTLFKTRLP